ncbi:MAG: hypothetical protein HOC43_00005, partial [Planctomycetes bacterium]|nr:hypothetical protein [Planctomycetota bacterium]
MRLPRTPLFFLGLLLAAAPAGLYTVLVTVPSGLTGELVDGFEVLAMAPSLSGIAPS